MLRDFPVAIEYHQRHLTIAQELGDKVGEARACWSLGNAHSSIGNHDKALNFAQQHYALAKDVRIHFRTNLNIIIEPVILNFELTKINFPTIEHSSATRLVKQQPE